MAWGPELKVNWIVRDFHFRACARAFDNLGLYPASGGVDGQMMINQIDSLIALGSLGFLGVDHINLPTGRAGREAGPPVWDHST